MPSIEIIALAAVIVLLAYTILGVSGFGSTAIAVPLLAHVLPLKFVIPLIVILDCVGSTAMGARLRADVDRVELKPLLPFLVGGLVVGAFLLVRLPAELLTAALGILVLSYGALYATGRHGMLRVGRWAAAPVGIFAGTTSSLLGVGGPIYLMYLAARGSTPEQLRATLPVIFIITTVVRIAMFAWVGLVTASVLYAAAALLPVMALGVWIGHRLHVNLTRAQLVRVIGALLVGSGGSLLLRAWG